MDGWPELVVGRRYAVNVASDGVVVKPRGVLAEVNGGWARIVHEERRTHGCGPSDAASHHSCWVPLGRVLTITELEPCDDEAHLASGQDAGAFVEPRERDGDRWRRPRPSLDQLTVSVLGA